jgi:large subunit ribosomal protein L18
MGMSKLDRRIRIKRRVRKNISGTGVRPRMSVYRSNKDIYVQIINDEQGVTLTSASSLKNAKAQKMPKIEQAKLIGKEIAEKAKGAGIEKVVFDRNGYLYHGRVKALADAAREAGLQF